MIISTRPSNGSSIRDFMEESFQLQLDFCQYEQELFEICAHSDMMELTESYTYLNEGVVETVKKLFGMMAKAVRTVVGFLRTAVKTVAETIMTKITTLKQKVQGKWTDIREGVNVEVYYIEDYWIKEAENLPSEIKETADRMMMGGNAALDISTEQDAEQYVKDVNMMNGIMETRESKIRSGNHDKIIISRELNTKNDKQKIEKYKTEVLDRLTQLNTIAKKLREETDSGVSRMETMEMALDQAANTRESLSSTVFKFSEKITGAMRVGCNLMSRAANLFKLCFNGYIEIAAKYIDKSKTSLRQFGVKVD